MALDHRSIRENFSALQLDRVFFDNPGGTQVAQHALDRMVSYLSEHNANRGGAFATSRASDEVLDEARSAVADFLNAERVQEIIFGPNMTTLTLSLSRSLAHLLNAGDGVVVTRLDHDANIAPWLQIAEARRCTVHWVDFDVEDGTLVLKDLERALEHRPKLVAVGLASNALGTINPVSKIVDLCRQAGSLVFVDAVQYAPHGPIDVQRLGCDFLACSAYKFFGPYVGILYGRHELLERLPAYKVRPASERPPGKFETGTQNHAGIAGVLGALEYLGWVGETFGQVYSEKYGDRFSGRRLLLKQAMAAVRAYEYELSRNLLEILGAIQRVHIHGLSDVREVEQRVPTVAFTLEGLHPRQIAARLDQAGINVWDGNYYALIAGFGWQSYRLGLEGKGGMVRVGGVHYNTMEEVVRLGEALEEIVS